MSPITDSENLLPVAYKGNALSPHHDTMMAKPGATISEIVAQGKLLCGHLVVECNGEVVPSVEWDTFRLRQGDILVVHAVPGDGDTLRSVLMVAVIIAAAVFQQWYLSPYAAGSLAGASAAWAAGSYGALAIAAAGAAAITLAGTMAINALIPPISPAMAGPAFSAKQLLNISAGGNYDARYQAIPKVLGTHRFFPPYAATPYTTADHDDIWLNCLFNLGEGALEVTDLRLGETPLDHFPNASYRIYRDVAALDGVGNSQTYIGTGVLKDVAEEGLAVKLLYGAAYTKISQVNTTKISFDISSPLLVYFNDDQSRSSLSVKFKVEYRPVTTPASSWIGGTENLLQPALSYILPVGVQTSSYQIVDDFATEVVTYNDSKAYIVYVTSSATLAIRTEKPKVAQEVVLATVSRCSTGVMSVEYALDTALLEKGITFVGGVQAALGITLDVTTGTFSTTEVTSSCDGFTVTGMDAVRQTFTIDNLTAAQYEVRITRLTKDYDHPQIKADTYISAFRSFTNKDAVTERNLTLVKLAIKATDQLNGGIYDFNCICSSVQRVFTNDVEGLKWGSVPYGSQAVARTTSGTNPYGATTRLLSVTRKAAMVMSATAWMAYGSAGLSNLAMPGAGTAWTVSFYAKVTAATIGNVRILAGIRSILTTADWHINLSTIIPLDSSWNRYSFTVTTPSSGWTGSAALELGIHYPTTPGPITDEILYYGLMVEPGDVTPTAFTEGAPNIVPPEFSVFDFTNVPHTADAVSSRFDGGTFFHDYLDVPGAVSSNPASLYLEVLTGNSNKKKVADAAIDMQALYEWYLFCADHGFTYDNVLVQASSIQATLAEIAAAGRATPYMRQGLYSVIWDTSTNQISQMFTPKNSWGFTASRIYPRVPHAFRVRHNDKKVGYRESEYYVYADGYNADGSAGKTAASIIEDLPMRGIVGDKAIYALGRYHLATLSLRPEIYSFYTDLENLVCEKGDLIKFQHDVSLHGVSSGRIKTVNSSGGFVTSIVVDEQLYFVTGTTYGVRIRHDASGLTGTTFPTFNVTAALLDNWNTTILPPAGTIAGTSIKAGDLFTFGTVVSGENGATVDLIVKSVEPGDDFTARITALDYAPAVFSADTETIPTYIPQITAPPDYLSGIVPTLDAGFRGAGVTDAEDIYPFGSHPSQWDVNPDGTLRPVICVALKPITSTLTGKSAIGVLTKVVFYYHRSGGSGSEIIQTFDSPKFMTFRLNKSLEPGKAYYISAQYFINGVAHKKTSLSLNGTDYVVIPNTESFAITGGNLVTTPIFTGSSGQWGRRCTNVATKDEPAICPILNSAVLSSGTLEFGAAYEIVTHTNLDWATGAVLISGTANTVGARYTVTGAIALDAGDTAKQVPNIGGVYEIVTHTDLDWSTGATLLSGTANTVGARYTVTGAITLDAGDTARRVQPYANVLKIQAPGSVQYPYIPIMQDTDTVGFTWYVMAKVWGDYLVTGTVASATSTTVTVGTSSQSLCDEFAGSANPQVNLVGLTLTVTGGTGSGQTRTITANANTLLTVGTAFSVTPDTTSTFSIQGTGAGIYVQLVDVDGNVSTVSSSDLQTDYESSGTGWALVRGTVAIPDTAVKAAVAIRVGCGAVYVGKISVAYAEPNATHGAQLPAWDADGTTLLAAGNLTTLVDNSDNLNNAGLIGIDGKVKWVLGGMVKTGVLESTNWATDAGSQFDLDAGTFKLGGSAAPALSWNGTALHVGTDTNYLEFNESGFDVNLGTGAKLDLAVISDLVTGWDGEVGSTFLSLGSLYPSPGTQHAVGGLFSYVETSTPGAGTYIGCVVTEGGFKVTKTERLLAGLSVGSILASEYSPQTLFEIDGATGTVTNVSFPGGAWTPTFLVAGGSHNWSVTLDQAKYVCIGSQVLYNFIIIINTKGTTTGEISIGGLPYPAPGVYYPVGQVLAVKAVSATLPIVCRVVGGGASTLKLFPATTTGTSLAALADTDFQTGMALFITGAYFKE